MCGYLRWVSSFFLSGWPRSRLSMPSQTPEMSFASLLSQVMNYCDGKYFQQAVIEALAASLLA